MNGANSSLARRKARSRPDSLQESSQHLGVGATAVTNCGDLSADLQRVEIIWEFAKGSKAQAVAVNGALVIDDMDMTVRAAMDGVGLAFSLEEYVAPHLASGALVRVLEDWCPPFAGFFLYYPSRRQQPAALSALIDTLRLAHNPK